MLPPRRQRCSSTSPVKSEVHRSYPSTPDRRNTSVRHGTSTPGAANGGVIEQLIHSVEIEVALDNIPEKLHVKINKLEIGGHLTIKDITDLPEGAKVNVDDDEMIVHCVMPAAEEEEAVAEEGATAEPEVIGKGKEDEEEESEEKE